MSQVRLFSLGRRRRTRLHAKASGPLLGSGPWRPRGAGTTAGLVGGATAVGLFTAIGVATAMQPGVAAAARTNVHQSKHGKHTPPARHATSSKHGTRPAGATLTGVVTGYRAATAHASGALRIADSSGATVTLVTDRSTDFALGGRRIGELATASVAAAHHAIAVVLRDPTLTGTVVSVTKSEVVIRNPQFLEQTIN